MDDNCFLPAEPSHDPGISFKTFVSSSLPPYLTVAWALDTALLLTFLISSQLPLLFGSVHVKMFNFHTQCMECAQDGHSIIDCWEIPRISFFYFARFQSMGPFPKGPFWTFWKRRLALTH